MNAIELSSSYIQTMGHVQAIGLNAPLRVAWTSI